MNKYEVRKHVVRLGAGLNTSGYVVLQDGKFKEFFKDRQEAENCASSLIKDSEGEDG